MEFKTIKNIKDAKIEGLIYGIYSQGEDKKPLLPDWIDKKAPELKDFFANLAQMVSFSNLEIEGQKIRKVILVGLGEKNKSNQLSFCSAYANAFVGLKQLNYEKIGLFLENEKFAKALSSQIEMANYNFSKYKEKKEQKTEIKEVYFISDKDITKEIEIGKIFAQAANYTRELQNEPPNLANPEYIAQKAKELASKNNLEIFIIKGEELKQKNLNALYWVGRGSAVPPHYVAILYKGNKNSKEIDLAIVGKGITFDSGGLSLKPSEYMEDMKFDKSGACAVLGIMEGISKLKLNKNVLGVLALAENLPSGSAYKPGDIIKAYNNKTIEVLNTDAEGRVALADALAYTEDKFKPKIMIDFATLTGACVVALGDIAAGILSEDKELTKKLIEAGERVNERLWELPTWEEYHEKVKSQIADVKNIGEKGMAGATAGYSFLRNFVNKARWAHIDIAGVAAYEKPKFGLEAGATGFGVRLTLEYLTNS